MGGGAWGRHGHAPRRVIQTGIGGIEVQRPRVRDRGAGDAARIRFTSAVLPAYLRRARNVEELLPWLYLKGLSTGQFEEALTVLLGPDAPGLSAATIRRLVSAWQDEHQRWQGRDLRAKRYVYVRADGIYFAPRLEHARQCMLVLIGADAGGKKEFLAIDDGFRESEQSWHELLDPELATGDGALGFWKAARKVWPTTGQQRCWVHKAANVLNYLPNSVQKKARADLHEIYEAASRADAEATFERSLAKYQAKYDKAAHCLEGSRGPARVLRLSRRALEARPEHQSGRAHLRDGAPADRQDQGLPVPCDRARPGVQARQVGRAPLAPVERLRSPRRDRSRRPLPRRRADHRCRGPGRCLT